MNLFRPLAVLTLALLALPGVGAQTVIDQLYGLRSYELADAYWAAGQKFTDLGQAERGAEFQARAKHLFPGYVPGQAPAFQSVQAAAVVEKPAPALPSAALVREANLEGEKIAKFQFQKLIRGYLVGDPSALVSASAGSVLVQGQAMTVDAAALATFFDTHPAEAGSPDELFRLATFEAVDGPGQSVVVRIRSTPEAQAALGDLLPFWKETQEYTFDRVGDTWKLIKVEGR